MITTTNYNTQKISLGSLQNKKSREGIEYQNIPILYDGKRAIVHLCGRFNLEEDVSFDSSPNYSNSLGVEVDADNRKLFEDFEEKLQSLTGDGELKLIKYGRVYLKIYVNDKGEMAPKFWEVFCEDGKEYKIRNLGRRIFTWKIYWRWSSFFNCKYFCWQIPKYYLCRKRNSCEGSNERKELFSKIPCLEKKVKFQNDNAFFCISKDSFEIHFFLFFLKTTCVNSIFVNNSFVVISR